MKPKVLFLDDDALMHRLYQPHLERAGYEVVGLMHSENVVQVAKREQPRVAIIDMILPGQDGLSTILLLKSSGQTNNIPIIAISADLGLHGMRQELERLGVKIFLSKPFGAAKLVQAILDCLAPQNGQE